MEIAADHSTHLLLVGENAERLPEAKVPQGLRHVVSFYREW